MAYCKDEEDYTSWEFSTLRTSPPVFYHAYDFKLYGRDPVRFPGFMQVSDNYFDRRW